nr:hypothetical protein [Pseudomonadota bacterium]
PQTDTLEAQVIAAINKQTSPANTASYWVAWKGKDNTLVAPAPKVAPLNSGSTNIYTSYYDDNVSVPRLRYVKDGVHGFTTSPTASATAAILIHSRRYKGVVSALPSQSRALKVLCWDPSAAAPGFVLSTASTSNQAGDATHLSAAEICWNENKFFIAPTKTLEWIDAMLLLAPNHSMLPWPQPKNASGAEIALNDEVTAASNNYLPAAWVGMSSDGTSFEQFYRYKFKSAFIAGADEKKDQTVYYLITGKLPTTLSTTLSQADLICHNNTTSAFSLETAVSDCPSGTSDKTILSSEWKNQSLSSLKSNLALIKSTYSSVSLSTMSGDARLNVKGAIVAAPPP